MTVEADREHLSVVIPTKNSAAVLGACLESVAWADELIVVDMFSTDDTADLCKPHPQCRFIQRQDYIFGNVNFGFDFANSAWITRLGGGAWRLTARTSRSRSLSPSTPAGGLGIGGL